MTDSTKWYFDDFTESAYRELIRTAKQRWEFIRYPEYCKEGRVILWRHDIDFSVHRALRLAEIEAQESVAATYFIHLHSVYYNALEKEVAELIGRILELGHSIGLHFDPLFYGSELEPDEFKGWLRYEKELIEKVFKAEVGAFSFHAPEAGGLGKIDVDEMEGMVNTYGKYLKENYGYCSDSNGHWRFRRLRDVLASGEDEKLHVLTHPGWWSHKPLSPRERVTRCIDGRAARRHARYDEVMSSQERKNIK